MSFSRRNFMIATGVVAASSTVLTACGGSGGGSSSGGDAPKVTGSKTMDIPVGTKADSTGPAPEVAGATKGGTIYSLEQFDMDHLDPAQIYVSTEGAITVPIMRGLTGYKIDEKGGVTLVGDAATDAGTSKDGGKTWSFTLKDGLKWEDGSAVTTDDVRHTFERLFASFITEGPRYVQQWLEGGEKYKGPYDGKSLSSVEVDGKTVTFRLNEPRGDFNYTLAMRGYALVPKKHDTKEKYDKRPFSCGPYKIASRSIGKSLTYTRNPHWDPKTDAIRNNYPDKYVFEFGFQPLAATDRYIADKGNDQYAVPIFNEVAAERIAQVLTNATLKKRVLTQVDTVTYYWPINTTRIKDVKVRQAINWAWPHQQLQTIRGGASTSEIATTILSPVTPGYEKFDLYGTTKKPGGDPAKAKALLKEAGKVGQKLVIAYQQSDNAVKQAVAIKNALEAAGFTVVNKQIDKSTFYTQIGKIDNGYDLFAAGWSPDWPNGYSVFYPCWSGENIGDGRSNYAQLDDTSVNKAINTAATITDSEKANKAWGAVDRQVMELAPVVPDYHSIRNWMYGSKVGNVVYDAGNTCVALCKVYVKK
ncbi:MULTISPECIES: ABC transporter substrate-binding protein [Streptomyces]|uniref:ABC transporter substrate-binding protein n=1 Tax=Streptomyces doudnae TaxID=3075536 RepID=A0ABD5EIS1_9ACTN|nr:MULTISPECIES: ABC transporter substrate-binding protein [unclassified Streptomyces]MDT0434496.1 ABC transporter substrate-binding protein [Streptomyces sp. DSM 41981]MYQ62996.1 ABC transporter substrate-binding protein [Streptomyces sp. SID4950]SCD48540.1 peptide/nickel transport system substrate-binding protein [Streptomyces sp. SolWspMP-5a-2]